MHPMKCNQTFNNWFRQTQSNSKRIRIIAKGSIFISYRVNLRDFFNEIKLKNPLKMIQVFFFANWIRCDRVRRAEETEIKSNSEFDKLFLRFRIAVLRMSNLNSIYWYRLILWYVIDWRAHWYHHAHTHDYFCRKSNQFQ